MRAFFRSISCTEGKRILNKGKMSKLISVTWHVNRYIRGRRRHDLFQLTSVTRKIFQFSNFTKKLTMNRRCPSRWQTFRCGGRRFIYSRGGRGAFQKLLDSPVSPAHSHRTRLAPDPKNPHSSIHRWDL